MKKIVLVDGSNIIFRSYYATMHNMMTNSKGIPTNALYGMANMLNKIINEEQPDYLLVALDKGKTFRHEHTESYKAGRQKTPEDLVAQFPLARELLTKMGIFWYEIEGYEADDIIGTISKINENDEVLIISSDQDLLQLIDKNTKVKLLKQKGHILYDEKKLFEDREIEPLQIIELKSLEGDKSDNIPGVKGIGPKKALDLLKEYKNLDGVYENLDQIKGKTREYLEEFKEDAYNSHFLATIYCDMELPFKIEDLSIKEDPEELREFYEFLEFRSMINKTAKPKEAIQITYELTKTPNLTREPCFVLPEYQKFNYHTSQFFGIGIIQGKNKYFVLKEDLHNIDFRNLNIITFDFKALYVLLSKNKLAIPTCLFDMQIAAYLTNKNIKDDVADLGRLVNIEIPYKEAFYKTKELNIEQIINYNLTKLSLLEQQYADLKEETQEYKDLYYELEMPLATTLAKMELEGIKVDQSFLEEYKEVLELKKNEVEQQIYQLAGDFNIASPKQLAEVLFEKLQLPVIKKTKTGYSTDAEVLEKLKDTHPVVSLVLEHRQLAKIISTYINGLIDAIIDGRIHTIYQSTLTQTGRLSSIEPNLQNLPIRTELGKEIRKAFISEHTLYAADYSQIELRILAHIANVQPLIEGFKNGMDVHTLTAMNIFHVEHDSVDANMRRAAKAVNFGIIYGMGPFSLAQDLNITQAEAKTFIKRYLTSFSGIENYMRNVVADCKLNGYTQTILGRRRLIPEINSANGIQKKYGERMALNSPIQGSAADVIKKAMVDIDNEFTRLNLKSKMILQIHDELVFDVVNDEKEQVQNIVNNLMENAIALKVSLNVEGSFGKNLLETK